VASWQSNGTIDYHGREDDQVKIRGYRIELNEIEQAIISYKGVQEVIVLAPTIDKDRELVSYIVYEGKLNTTEIREHLFKKLPEHMVPAIYIQVDRFPLTANGKIDKKKLPDPVAHMTDSHTHQYVAPGNEVEVKLVEIWSEILGVKEGIGVKDNFFELGGHSIKAIKILSRISRDFGIVISIQKMFEEPTIEHLANEILNARWFNAQLEKSGDAQSEKIKF
jgi:acyl carrier protein